MKNSILSVIILIMITDISYASFPVVDSIQNENINTTVYSLDSGGILFTILSVLLSLLSIFFIFLFIGNGMAHNGNPFPYLLLSIASIISTIVTARISRKRGGGKLKSLIGVFILIISILLIRYLIFV